SCSSESSFPHGTRSALCSASWGWRSSLTNRGSHAPQRAAQQTLASDHSITSLYIIACLIIHTQPATFTVRFCGRFLFSVPILLTQSLEANILPKLRKWLLLW